MTQANTNRIQYLDGLRAVAILAVLIYHGNNAWLSGGYLGVEIFFVISGFIITRLLHEEWKNSNYINFWRFYHRRWMRLFPALLVVSLVVWIIVLLLHPEDIMQIRTDLPYAISFTSNLDYILNNRSYFDTSGRQRLFEHFWSLGIEFQFYLLWPITCLWLFHRQPRTAVLLAILGSVLGYSWMAYMYVPNQDPSRVYFGTDTRIGAFLIGATVAILAQQQPLRPTNLIYQAVFSLIGILSFVVLLLAFYFLDSTNPILFYGGFAATALVTGMVIFYCHNIESTRQNTVLSILSNNIMVGLGLRSYSIYLWHWPIFCLTQPGVDINLDGFCLFELRLAATLLCSEITYNLIETPFRRGLLRRTWKSLPITTYHGWQWATGTATSITIIIGGYVLYQATETATANLAQLSSRDNMFIPIPSKPLISPDTVQNTNLQPEITYETNPSNGYIKRMRTNIGKKSTIVGIGDSVMISARNELLRQMPSLMFDARVGRQMIDAITLLNTDYKSQLGDVILIHLGNNGPFNADQIEKVMHTIANTGKVIFVNLKLPRNYEQANNQLLTNLANTYSNVKIIDWRSSSLNDNLNFAKDGIHLTEKGANLYAKMIRDALCSPDIDQQSSPSCLVPTTCTVKITNPPPLSKDTGPLPLSTSHANPLPSAYTSSIKKPVFLPSANINWARLTKNRKPKHLNTTGTRTPKKRLQ